MNKLKSVVANRLGGDLWKELKKASFAKRIYGGKDPLLDVVLRKKDYFVAGFFFGNSVMQRRYCRNLYEMLCKLYTASADNSLFDFNGIILPKMKTDKDINSFTVEFLAHFLYYVLKNKDACDILAIQQGPYEYGEVRIQKDDIYIDAGANTGINSAVASRKGASVYAFEPSLDIVNSYLSIAAANNPNINICKYALSNKQEDLNFVIGSTIGTGTLEVTGLGKSSNDVTTVKAIPLDIFVQEKNLPRVDFIKSDIEGAERYMLMGAKQVLKDFAPKLSICKYHLPDDPEALRELILDANPKYVIEERLGLMYAHVP
jgi:FkbM family methyltransferase